MCIIFFFNNLRKGAVGEREQKVGSAVRQEKGPRAVVSTKDNANLGASIQVIIFFNHEEE
jgi:hypothetical protein